MVPGGEAANTVWVIVPGFGLPRIEDKLVWLRDNVSRLVAGREGWKVRMTVFCYAKDPIAAAEWPANPELPVEIVYEPGIVFQYLYRHITPAAVEARAAYVLLLLDDVRLGETFSLPRAIGVYERVQCDLLEPALTPASPTFWDFSRQDREPLRRGYQGRRTNFVEFFATLLSASAYRRYYTTCLTDTTAWGWGVDLTLDSLGFRLFLWDACPVTHEVRGGSYRQRPDKDPHAEMADTKARLAAKGGRPLSFWRVYEYL